MRGRSYVFPGAGVVNHFWRSITGSLRGQSYVEQCCREYAWSIKCGEVLPGICVVDHMWSSTAGLLLVDHMRICVTGSSRGQSKVEQCCRELTWSIICGAVLPGAHVVDHMWSRVVGSSRGRSYEDQCYRELAW